MVEKREQRRFAVAACGGAFGRGAAVLAQFEQRRLFRLGSGAPLLLPQFHDVTPQEAPALGPAPDSNSWPINFAIWAIAVRGIVLGSSHPSLARDYE
jgi:hypothetical protein